MGQSCAPPLRWNGTINQTCYSDPAVRDGPASVVRRARVGSGVDIFWGNGLGILFHMKRQQHPPTAAQNAEQELTWGEGNRAELAGDRFYGYKPQVR